MTWRSDWPQVLEAGWGSVWKVTSAPAFVSSPCVREGRGPLLCGSLLRPSRSRRRRGSADEVGCSRVRRALALETALVSGCPGACGATAVWSPDRLSRPLLALAAIGAVPWLAYALDMSALNREGRLDADITIGIDTTRCRVPRPFPRPAELTLAALRWMSPPARSLIAAVAASYLGLVSLCLAGPRRRARPTLVRPAAIAWDRARRSCRCAAGFPATPLGLDHAQGV